MTKQVWDAAAASFDDEPDHGLTDPAVRAAWRDLLLGVLPEAPAAVADLGCGTGTLCRVLADEGYTATGLDFSPAMIERARAKVPEAHLVLGDASAPDLDDGAYDVVLCRHVLWALPDPVDALARWVRLLRPDGRIILIDGRWHTGGGLTADSASEIVRSTRTSVTVHPLQDPIYWGGPIDDERYMLVSEA